MENYKKRYFLIIFDGFWSKYDEFRPNQNFEISATFDLDFDPQDDVIEKFWHVILGSPEKYLSNGTGPMPIFQET